MEVSKIPGTENPVDLMTKILTVKEIEERLKGINIVMHQKHVNRSNLREIGCVTLVGDLQDPCPRSLFA